MLVSFDKKLSSGTTESHLTFRDAISNRSRPAYRIPTSRPPAPRATPRHATFKPVARVSISSELPLHRSARPEITMFETAIRYLVDSDDGVETILVGGLLTLFSWLLLPAVLVAGYLQRVLVRTDADDPAPSFDDWGDLFGDGLKAIAVTLAYFAVPAILLTAVLASLLVFSVETTVVDSSTVTDPATVAEPVTNVGPGLLSVWSSSAASRSRSSRRWPRSTPSPPRSLASRSRTASARRSSSGDSPASSRAGRT